MAMVWLQNTDDQKKQDGEFYGRKEQHRPSFSTQHFVIICGKPYNSSQKALTRSHVAPMLCALNKTRQSAPAGGCTILRCRGSAAVVTGRRRAKL